MPAQKSRFGFTRPSTVAVRTSPVIGPVPVPVTVTRPFLPGYLIGAALQRYAPDVTFGGTTRNALELNLQAFPWAHTELHLLTRAEATGGDTTHPNLLALLQLHYYL